MIRFGPAAAPRWFDSSLERFSTYLDILQAAGASQIEFVVHPGTGSDELGRVHLLESQWSGAVRRATARGFHVDFHAPLTSEFRMTAWQEDAIGYETRFEPVVRLIGATAAVQPMPPVLVLHAADDDPALTRAYLRRLLELMEEHGIEAGLAVELRAPAVADDRRFDRSLHGLIHELERLGHDRVGICWDVAHDWESGFALTDVDDEAWSWIRHVHIHDSRVDGAVHAPLGAGEVPWEEALRQLQEHGYTGSITLEIRYRYASEHGQPWDVLGQSLISVRRTLLWE